MYSAATVWLAAAITVSSQGVAGVSVGMLIFNPPASMGVCPAARVIVGEAALDVPVKDAAVELGELTETTAVDAGLVRAGCPGLAVAASVGSSMAASVSVAVNVAVGENAGSGV